LYINKRENYKIYIGRNVQITFINEIHKVPLRVFYFASEGHITWPMTLITGLVMTERNVSCVVRDKLNNDHYDAAAS
jgi:hypothetical protein